MEKSWVDMDSLMEEFGCGSIFSPEVPHGFRNGKLGWEVE